MFDEFHDPQRDDPRVKVIDLGTNKLSMKRTDPYGFINLSLERGQLPEYMRGHYTTWESAQVDVNKYMAERASAKPEAVPEAPKKKIA